MDDLVEHHERACAGFQAIADRVPDDQWDAPTPCTEWDARALVEHVIGFHEFLLLRPMGVRAHRPREGSADRWRATADALFVALGEPDALERETELPGGGTSTPRTMLAALTTDVLVHTWDLARGVGLDVHLDPELTARAYDAASATDLPRDGGMIGPAVPVDDDADVESKLVGLYGRDPGWAPTPRTP